MNVQSDAHINHQSTSSLLRLAQTTTLPRKLSRNKVGFSYHLQTFDKLLTGGTIVDDSSRFLGMITVEMSDEIASSLKSFTGGNVISVEPDQEVSIQPTV
ncbi:hypothetical protein CY34DRAFT_10599 [Suillus luteus UH-Slu-Lm8-n1]|uniref:Unplaced genomic scaffold CY34scaffold_47, whole genome shotgun sequence n=1 Tax=Suillus luteus UH-Slu-Lm8-n1 TaxID=930992 RepID=A0A0D0A4T0_9AGAM|nr:hypothetical protein CY34DRAFT_10599 [Suillus luteus UH-Slu-Lm8-n1]